MTSNENTQSRNNRIDSYNTLYVIFQVTGLLIVCCVFYWIVHFRGGFSFTVPKIIFNWHALLMTIAFVYLLANSILHYRTFRDGKKENLKNQHAVCNGCIIIVILLAGSAALVSHLYASPPIANLYSLHSWIGMVTVVMFLFQTDNRIDTGFAVRVALFIGGLTIFLYPGTTVGRREAAAPYHVFFGVFNFVLALATAVLGFGEKLIFTLYGVYVVAYYSGVFITADKEYQNYAAEGLFGNCLCVLCVFYGGLVVYMVTKPEFKRRPTPEYEPLL